MILKTDDPVTIEIEFKKKSFTAFYFSFKI
jgi:hypothetical protein